MAFSTQAGKFLGQRPTAATSAFFQCDIQEVFRPVMANFSQLEATAKFLNTVAKELAIPVLSTEQIPFITEGKNTPPCLRDDHITFFHKKLFSMCTDEVKGWLTERPGVKDIYLYGIETHICVLQTSLDLLRMNYNVYLVVDAAFSQRDCDRTVALNRLERSGVVLTTAESAVFEILGEAGTPVFKACLPAVKELGNFHRNSLKHKALTGKGNSKEAKENI
eukprot:CAMPEP_0175120286 /NCGR_PEP_ID=MMETSP0087-20121206/536_1 /TAXON_ID=136419 /ORGANISM="Unknown Unknown, Strain D1" /LENGTH=220 /DNA_ID=CAMNT_0016401715 /DNA_START=60 /DNA_END=722 /DNA_ORIENTATION=-